MTFHGDVYITISIMFRNQIQNWRNSECNPPARNKKQKKYPESSQVNSIPETNSSVHLGYILMQTEIQIKTVTNRKHVFLFLCFQRKQRIWCKCYPFLKGGFLQKLRQAKSHYVKASQHRGNMQPITVYDNN